MHGIGAQFVGAPRIKGAVRRDIHRVRKAGRFGDTELAHIGPEADAILKAAGGAGTRNPETGVKEHFKLKDLISIAAPIATNILFPGAGSAIGGALGLSGAAANVAGNAILSGGIGALTGGKRGALIGAGTGAAMAGFKELGGFEGIGGRLGIGGGAAPGSAPGQGAEMPDASGADILKTEINPSEAGVAAMPQPPAPEPTGLGAVAATAPSVRGAAGVPAGTTADKGDVNWGKLALLGGGALLLGGAGNKPEQQAEPASASLAGGFGGPLPKYELDRAYAAPNDVDLIQFGRGYRGRSEGTFYDAPGRYRAYKDGGKAEPWRPFEQFDEYRRPGIWRGDEIKPNQKPSTRTRKAAERLEQMGQNGDTILAHINPEEAALLKSIGGSGTVNPHTGLLEFFEGSDAADSHGSSSSGAVGIDGGMGSGSIGFDSMGEGTPGNPGPGTPGPAAASIGTDPFESMFGPPGPPVTPSYAQQSGFFDRASDRLAASIKDALGRPVETGINALVGLTTLGLPNSLIGALTGWDAGRAATSIGRGIGDTLGLNSTPGTPSVGVSSPTDTPNRNDNPSPTSPGSDGGSWAPAPTAQLVSAPSTIAQLAASAPTPANLQSASRQARTPTNAELLQFGRGYGGIGTGTFYDVPNTVRAKDGGEISDGRSDDIPAVLSHGEHVLDAEFISLVGNGDNDAGHKKIEKWKADLRRQKGRALARGKISPDAKIPKVA